MLFAAMPPSVKPPSPSLLRFLRAQSEGLTGECVSSRCARTRAIVHNSNSNNNSSNGISRRRNACTAAAASSTITTTATTTSTSNKFKSQGRPLSVNAAFPITRRNATLQAGLINLDSIIPKSLRKQRNSNPLGIPPSKPGAPRFASSDPNSSTPVPSALEADKPRWRELLFGSARQKREAQAKEDEIRLRMEEQSGSIFPRRSLTAKAAMDPRLRCTEVDENGRVVMVDGELKKSELIARVSGICLYSLSLVWSRGILLTASVLTTVRSATPRSAQDRLVQSSTHPRAPIRHPPQLAPPQGPDQARLRLAVRRVRLQDLVPPVGLHVRPSGEAAAEAGLVWPE